MLTNLIRFFTRKPQAQPRRHIVRNIVRLTVSQEVSEIVEGKQYAFIICGDTLMGYVTVREIEGEYARFSYEETNKRTGEPFIAYNWTSIENLYPVAI